MRRAAMTCAAGVLAACAAGCTHARTWYVSVVTMWPGASASQMDANVTRTIEEAVRTLPGLDDVDSVSVAGTSSVFLRLHTGAKRFVLHDDDADRMRVIADAHDRLAAALAKLPPGASSPILRVVDDGTVPVVRVGLHGTLSRAAATATLDDFVRPLLERVPGVDQVTVEGGARREIDVRVDAARALAHGLTPAAVARALRDVHGKSLDDIAHHTIADTPAPLTVADVATVSDGDRLDGAGRLDLVVWKRGTSSRREVEQAVRNAVHNSPGSEQATLVVEPSRDGSLSVVFSGGGTEVMSGLTADAARLVERAGVSDVEVAPASLPLRTLEIDRDRAAALGMSPGDVAEALSVAGGGVVVAQLDAHRDIDVRVSQIVDDKKPLAPQLYTRSSSGVSSLDGVLHETFSASPAVLERKNGVPAVRVCARVNGSVDDAVQAARKAVATLKLPPGVRALVEGGPLLPDSPCAAAMATAPTRTP